MDKDSIIMVNKWRKCNLNRINMLVSKENNQEVVQINIKVIKAI